MPGLELIPVKLLQTGSQKILHVVYDFIVISWRGIPIPMLQDWIDVIFVSLYKGKIEKSIYDHYRGIILLGSVGKVLARFLFKRLTENICPGVIYESQNLFRSGRGTVDMFFSVRQIQGKLLNSRSPCIRFLLIGPSIQSTEKHSGKQSPRLDVHQPL